MQAVSDVLFLFLLQYSVGAFLVVTLIPAREIDKSYFRFTSLLLLVLLGICLALSPYPWPGPGWSASIGGWGMVTLLLFLGALLIWKTTEGNQAMTLSRPATWVGMLLGITAVAMAGLSNLREDWTVPMATVAALGTLGSGILSGSVTQSMALGHAYLIGKPPPFILLERYTKCFLGALGARVVLTGAGLLTATTVFGSAALTNYFKQNGLFIGIRVIVGLIVPIILAIMVWRCVKIKSNQSATGILYVAVIFVLIGEMCAAYLFITQEIPV